MKVLTAGLNHTTRITLFRDSPRIECRNDITQNFADVRTWAFSFNLAGPDVHFEEVGAVLRAKTQSQGGHYSDRAQNCRYDWLTLNHFADMTGTNVRAQTCCCPGRPTSPASSPNMRRTCRLPTGWLTRLRL